MHFLDITTGFLGLISWFWMILMLEWLDLLEDFEDHNTSMRAPRVCWDPRNQPEGRSTAQLLWGSRPWLRDDQDPALVRVEAMGGIGYLWILYVYNIYICNILSYCYTRPSILYCVYLVIYLYKIIVNVYIYVWIDLIWFWFDLIDWLIDLVDWLLIIISFWRHPLTGKATASWVEMVVVYDAGIGTCHWRESTVSFVPCYSFKILKRCPAWNWSSLWPKWFLPKNGWFPMCSMPKISLTDPTDCHTCVIQSRCRKARCGKWTTWKFSSHHPNECQCDYPVKGNVLATRKLRLEDVQCAEFDALHHVWFDFS
jgi:hypothetical protein